MRLTRSSIILAVVGVLLIVAAAVVRFVVVPSVTQLPEDLDVTLRFEGTYTGINPAVLTGDATELLLQDAPIEASRRVQGSDSDGDTETVLRTDTRAINGGEPASTEVRWRVDRETAEATETDESGFTSAEGLVFTLPVDPEPESGTYTWWDQDTLQATPLNYVGEDTVGGRDVYRYETDAAEGELADPAALGLPDTLPKDLASLAPAIAENLDDAQKAQLAAALPTLPDEIPISWTSKTTTRVVADQELGATIAGGSTQEITGTLDFGGTPVVVTFATIDLDSTGASDAQRGSDVGDDASLLNLVGTVLPIVALVLGLLLLIAAILLAVRAARRTGGTPPAATSDAGATAAA